MGKLMFLDGAFGTRIWDKTADNKPVWVYNILQPDVIREVTMEYIEAGAQIVQANTFGANRIAVEKEGSYSVDEVVSAAVRIAKEATAGTDIKIALSAGPLTVMMEPYGDLEEEEVAEIYDEMFRAGIREGADLITLETFMDLEMLRVAAEKAKAYNVPVFCTMSFEESGRTMFGNAVEDIAKELKDAGVDAVGLNCSLGPDKAAPIIKQFAEATDLPLVFKPNAGLPVMREDGTMENPYTKEDFVQEVKEVIPLVSYIGGCCGTDPSYIALLRKTYGQN
ncbi:MAG: homocysteine S-methyltransferase family protein [Eubacterium sp.]|nr:homocysteine S-methyltransferase family protein [Eubacterium sp.]